jgi:hypothetical protein
VDCIGSARTPTTFDFKLPGNHEIEVYKKEMATIQDMIEKKNGMF